VLEALSAVSYINLRLDLTDSKQRCARTPDSCQNLVSAFCRSGTRWAKNVAFCLRL